MAMAWAYCILLRDTWYIIPVLVVGRSSGSRPLLRLRDIYIYYIPETMRKSCTYVYILDRVEQRKRPALRVEDGVGPITTYVLLLAL